MGQSEKILWIINAFAILVAGFLILGDSMFVQTNFWFGLFELIMGITFIVFSVRLLFFILFINAQGDERK